MTRNDVKEQDAAPGVAARHRVEARDRAAEMLRRSADLHGRSADFWTNHAKLDRLAGRDELANEMEKHALRERELEAREMRQVERLVVGEAGSRAAETDAA